MSRAATVGGSALGIAVGWNVSNIGAIAEPLAGDYGVSLATVGAFTTALFVTHAGFQLPAGRAVDARGPRRVGLLALAIIAATNGLALVAPEPGVVVAARIVMGTGTALGFVGGLDYVRSQGGSPLAQGLYGGLSLGAGGFALAVVPQLEPTLGWRAPFLSALVLTGLAALILALSPRDRGRSRSLRGEETAGDLGSVLRDRRLYRLCGIYMASFGLAIVLGNWVVTLLTRAADYSEATAGLVGSLVLVGGIVSRPLGGFATKRFPHHIRGIVAGSFVVSALATVVLVVAGPVALSAGASLVLGLAAGIPFAASFGAAARVRPDAPATSVAMVNMAANLLIVVATPLLGLAFSLPGQGRVGFAVVVGLWAAAAVLVLVTRELEPPEARHRLA